MAHYDSSTIFFTSDGFPLSEAHKKSLKAAIRKTAGSNSPSLVIKAGFKAPSFALRSHEGKLLNSLDLIRKGPLILIFFRGLWCWYSYSKLLNIDIIAAQITSRGASIIAVSPQIQFTAQDLERIQNISFPILCDHNNKVASEYGVMLPLSESIKRMYNNLGVDLSSVNGRESDGLPIASQFIIDKQGVVVFAEINADDTDAARVDELLIVLDSMSSTRTTRPHS